MESQYGSYSIVYCFRGVFQCWNWRLPQWNYRYCQDLTLMYWVKFDIVLDCWVYMDKFLWTYYESLEKTKFRLLRKRSQRTSLMFKILSKNVKKNWNIQDFAKALKILCWSRSSLKIFHSPRLGFSKIFQQFCFWKKTFRNDRFFLPLFFPTGWSRSDFISRVQSILFFQSGRDFKRTNSSSRKFGFFWSWPQLLGFYLDRRVWIFQGAIQADYFKLFWINYKQRPLVLFV